MRTRTQGLAPGLIGVVDIGGPMGESPLWTGRTLPANVVVLSVTTGGEVASDKDDRPAPGLALTGVATRAALYKVTREVQTTMALLDPRWLFAVLGVDAHQCTDRRLGLAELIPQARCHALHAIIQSSATPQARMEALARWLDDAARQARQRPHRRPASPMDRYVPLNGKPAAGSLSQRQQERLFRRDHGLSMARHRTIERFQQAVAGLAFSQHSGALLAADMGFSDQSHMCHSIRQHSGLAPTRLKQQLSAGSFTAIYAAMPRFGKQLVL